MANDFSGDSNCKALWRFESGALTTDSKGTNTLTDNNTVGTDTVNYKEGAASADFELANSESLSITDTNLDSGFPLKSGDTNKKLSACAWVKPESLPSGAVVFSKYVTTGNLRSFQLRIGATGKFDIVIGRDSGVNFEISSSFGTALQTGKWYHVGVTFQASDKSYRIRVWDDTAGALLDTDLTGTFTFVISVTTAAFAVGATANPTNYWDGLIDEVVIFDDILTTTEIDEIRAGTFGASGGTTVTGILPAMSGLLTTKTAYHRSVEGSI